MRDKISLFDVHGALSGLVHAVHLALDPIVCEVAAHWQGHGIYLSVTVECRERDKQRVIDQLSQGAIHGKYDYRFSLSYPTMPNDPDDWTVVTAYPDIHHDDRRVKGRAKEAA